MVAELLSKYHPFNLILSAVSKKTSSIFSGICDISLDGKNIKLFWIKKIKRQSTKYSDNKIIVNIFVNWNIF